MCIRDSNTAYDGLNVIATRDIALNEELTLDYATFLDETMAVSYTHLRAHETVLDLVCRLLLETQHLPRQLPHLSFLSITYNTISLYYDYDILRLSV